MTTEPTWQQKLVEIDEVVHKVCNDWECGFIDDMMGMGEGFKPSEKQLAVIDKIYQKVCESAY